MRKLKKESQIYTKVGTKSGDWNIISIESYHPMKYNVCCDKGHKKVMSHGVVYRKTRCRECFIESLHGNKGYAWRGSEYIPMSYWDRLSRDKLTRASKTLVLSVSIDDADELYQKQNFKCALSGLDIDFKNRSASLDRIDSSRGYVEGNIQWVHKNVNLMKNCFEESYFIEMCRKVYEYSLLTLKQDFNCECNNTYSSKRPHNWTGCGHITGCYWYNLKQQAQFKNKRLFNISIEEANDLLISQNMICKLSGVHICFHKKTASLDRIDSLKGYEINNVQWVHKDVNTMKSNLLQARFLELCYLITGNIYGETTQREKSL